VLIDADIDAADAESEVISHLNTMGQPPPASSAPASSSSAAASAAAPDAAERAVEPQPAVVAAPVCQVREDSRGNVFIDGRKAPLGRITSWGLSVSAACAVHSGCRRPYSFARLPYASVLQDWLRCGIDVPSAVEHMALAKPSR
jgi:hypothetical protein